MSLVGEAEVGAMAGVSGPVAVASGIATAAAGGGDRTGSEIAQLSDLPEQTGLLILEVRQRLKHNVPPVPSVLYTLGTGGTKKENLTSYLLCRAPPVRIWFDGGCGCS